ncbi:MAG: hypothetical protein HUU29_11495 [Planctomycetaceae bacterium]|nr:hypothetical protein [Planctomycetaceae bacterium]
MQLEYVKALVAADKNISMGAVRKAVLKKYEVHINFKKLRAAFIAAGGKVRRIGRGASPYSPTFVKKRRRPNQHDVADAISLCRLATMNEIRGTASL